MTVNVKYWAPRVSNTVIIHHLNHLDQWYTFSEQVYKHLPKHSRHQNLFLRILHSRIPLIHPSYTMSELFNHKLFAFLFFSTHLVQKFQLKCSANNLKRFYGLNADRDLEIQVKTAQFIPTAAVLVQDLNHFSYVRGALKEFTDSCCAAWYGHVYVKDVK